MALTRAGGAIGIPGLYVTDDPGAKDANAKQGMLGLRIGLGWAKSHSFGTGQCPVLRYNRQLMMAILHNKVAIAKAVNVTVLPLEDAPRGYNAFDKGAAEKFVLDPHGIVRTRCLLASPARGRPDTGGLGSLERAARADCESPAFVAQNRSFRASCTDRGPPRRFPARLPASKPIEIVDGASKIRWLNMLKK